jgi:hypothetical protein
MTGFGYFLAFEEHRTAELVEQARMAEHGSRVDRFRRGGGGAKPVCGGLKVCWGTDEREAVRTAHRLWATEQLPGELAQILPTPSHFEQASRLVTVGAHRQAAAPAGSGAWSSCAPKPRDRVGWDAQCGGPPWLGPDGPRPGTRATPPHTGEEK